MFQGQLMICKNCGWEMRSSSAFESQWTTVIVDDTQIFYFCPKCWGVPFKLWPQETRDSFAQFTAAQVNKSGGNDGKI